MEANMRNASACDSFQIVAFMRTCKSHFSQTIGAKWAWHYIFWRSNPPALFPARLFSHLFVICQNPCNKLHRSHSQVLELGAFIESFSDPPDYH
eukprot:1161004-Pelagomonas_calceolata.AAC.2